MKLMFFTSLGFCNTCNGPLTATALTAKFSFGQKGTQVQMAFFFFWCQPLVLHHCSFGAIVLNCSTGVWSGCDVRAFRQVIQLGP